MTTILDQHQAAGRRYAEACAELQSAIIELAALERILPPDPMQTFEAAVPDDLGALKHRQFVPHPPQGIRAAVSVRAAQMGQG